MKRNKTESATEVTKVSLKEYEVFGVHEFNNGNIAFNLKANGHTFYGLRAVESKKGDLFITEPSYKGNDGNYYRYYYLNLDEKSSESILAEVIAQVEKPYN